MSSTEKDKSEYREGIDFVMLLLNYLRSLSRIWVAIVALAIVFGGIAVFRAHTTYVPYYTASSTFTINIKSEQSIYGSVAYYDNAAAEHMAQTFPYILTSSYLYRVVNNDMKEPITGSIHASVVENTNLLTLSVTDRDPDKAYRTLNSVIKCYPDVSEPIVGKVTMKVLDETGIPDSPDNQRSYIKPALIGMLIGTVIGLLWGMLIYITNRTIHSSSEIKKYLGISCLGSIPKIFKRKRSRKTSDYYTITDAVAKDLLTEPFRMIKNKIEYHSHKHDHKTFLVTSATAGEGKSFFAVNLALTLAQSGKKVVIIDCDLRHPTGRQIFDMPDGKGLGEYLKEEWELADYLNTAKTENNHNIPNLLFLPGGAVIGDGSRLLSGPRLQNLIASAKANADYVILDSAPAGLLTDSAILAKYADAALIVIRKEFARVDFILDTFKHLSDSDIHIVGGILNDT